MLESLNGLPVDRDILDDEGIEEEPGNVNSEER